MCIEYGALAFGSHSLGMFDMLFLRAERLVDGQRTFRLIEEEPLPTSYGEDLYLRIFGTSRKGTTENSIRERIKISLYGVD